VNRGRGGRRNGPNIEFDDDEQPKLPTSTEPEPLFPVDDKYLKFRSSSDLSALGIPPDYTETFVPFRACISQ
jgi:hypothetical protein